MTIFNGSVDLTNVPCKRTVREPQQNVADITKRLQQKLIQQMKENSVNAVRTYTEYITLLQNVHNTAPATLDWESLSMEPHPRMPINPSLLQLKAEYNFQAYKPTMSDYLTLRRGKKIRELSDKIESARREDDLLYNAVLKQYRNDVLDWKKRQIISKGVKDLDPAFYQQAVTYFNPFSAVTRPGLQLNCDFFSNYVVINLHLDAAKIIPDYILTKTAEGKLSNAQMKASNYNRLLCGFVCGCTLRAAKECLAILPVQFICVNFSIGLVGRISGIMESCNILSVKFDHKNLQQADLQNQDAADLIGSFVHRMVYVETDGFAAVEKITEVSGKYPL